MPWRVPARRGGEKAHMRARQRIYRDANWEKETWYLKTKVGSQFGPFTTEMLRDLAARARLAPDSVISQDKQTWIPVHTLPSLGMIWMAYAGNGSQFGPFNLMAASRLVQMGRLSRDCVLANTATGKTVPLTALIKAEALADLSMHAVPDESDNADEEPAAETPVAPGQKDEPQPQKAGWWYLRLPGGKVYGTFPQETLREWAVQGRVLPDSEVSADRDHWQPIDALEGIGMDWTVQLKDGRDYGPFNILATPVLVKRGIITPESVVRNRISGKSIQVAQLLAGGEVSDTAVKPEPAAVKAEDTAPAALRQVRQAELQMPALGRTAREEEEKLTARVTQLQQDLGTVRGELERERETRFRAERTLERLREETPAAPPPPDADPAARLLADWHLKLADGTVYGPAKLSMLREWAAQSRIGPDSEVSTDRSRWVAARDVPELDMDWLVLDSDGTADGPYNLSVVAEMLAQKTITPETIVKHRLGGKTRPAADLPASELACLQERIGLLERRLAARAADSETAGMPGIPGRRVSEQIRRRLYGTKAGDAGPRKASAVGA